MSQKDATTNSIGMFGHSSAEFTNLGLENVSIDDANASLTGVLVAQSKYAYFRNIFVTGDVNAKNNTGGLVGMSVNSNFDNIYSFVNITTEMGGVVGGIVGNVYGSFIKNSSFRGSINNDAGLQTGGIAGKISDGSEVIDSDSQGTISGGYYVGGLVGTLNSGSLVRGSYFNGNVSGEDNIGGLVGSSYTGTWIEKSYSSGSVNGKDNVGGVVGINTWATVQDSYSTAEVTGITKVGGIVGWNNG
ncbi:GLUG motif-containing protein, partial [Aliarcobacter cryaerophilus]